MVTSEHLHCVFFLYSIFFCQRFGTDKVSIFFSPIILLWFTSSTHGSIGVYNIIIYYPSPHHLYCFFKTNGKGGWEVLGAVFMCITGAEAMFADLGHFNKTSIPLKINRILIVLFFIVFFSIEVSYMTSLLVKVPRGGWVSFAIAAFFLTIMLYQRNRRNVYEVGTLEDFKVGVEKYIGKQGLKKKVLREGECTDFPDNGDEVEVHYVGTLLDGTKFDSSHDRGTPFKFILGQGKVMEGLDQGIKTMKKGETALFTVPSELAFADSGYPPTIPPNVEVQFEVEILSWCSTVKDICKDGGILMKTITGREKWGSPKDLDKVFVKYEARLEDDTLVSKSEGVEFTVKNGYFCPALSKAVKTMKNGEKVVLTVKPQYGFGEMGRPASSGVEGVVPPNATLLITLELVSWKSITKGKELLDMDLSEKIEVAGKKKEEKGDSILLKAGKKAANSIDYNSPKVMKVNSNLCNATCNLKLEGYKEAVKLCTEVLEIEAQNVTAFHIRAQAYIQLGELDLADSDIKNALEIDPHNRDLLQEYETLRKKKMEEYANNPDVYVARFFSLQPFLNAESSSKGNRVHDH